MRYEFRRGLKILKNQGFPNLLWSTAKYFISNLCYRPWYFLKARLLGDYTVSLGDVEVDLDDEVFSELMIRLIRRKVYESTETILIKKHVDPDYPVIDLGAGIGYTTCLLKKNVKEDVRVVGVEANPKLVPAIERTKDLNQSYFKVINAAYHSSKDSVEFNIDENLWSSSQYKHSKRDQVAITVPAICLSGLREEFELSGPFQLVLDIEGGEHDLIINEGSILERYCKLMIIEFHAFTGHETHYYKEKLVNHGFQFVEESEGVCVFRNTIIND